VDHERPCGSISLTDAPNRQTLMICPIICGQFDDSCLMKAFGQASMRMFFMSSTIEDEICRNFDVKVIGRINDIKQKYYAISSERKVKHPAVAAICDSARRSLFGG
jgi:LysR family transcriptional activator of nhaA